MKSAFRVMAPVLLLFGSAVEGGATVYTGCLRTATGSLYNVHEGDVPMKPCGPHDREISWNLEGAPGPQGEPGVDGVDGVNGMPGLNGRDGADGVPGPPGPAAPVEGTQTPFFLYLHSSGASQPVPTECDGRNIVVEQIDLRVYGTDAVAYAFVRALAPRELSFRYLPTPESGQRPPYSAIHDVTWRLPPLPAVELFAGVVGPPVWQMYLHGYCVDDE